MGPIPISSQWGYSGVAVLDQIRFQIAARQEVMNSPCAICGCSYETHFWGIDTGIVKGCPCGKCSDLHQPFQATDKTAWYDALIRSGS